MSVIVKQKTKGRGEPWWVFIHHDRIRRTKSIGDKQAAEAIASELRRRIKAGELNLDAVGSEPKTPRFEDYSKHYVDHYAKTACKWSTWKGYQAIINHHLLPVWRNLRLEDITRAEVKRLILQKQQAGFARGTVENFKALISGIFTHAYEDGLIAVNPALKLGKFLSKHDRRVHVRPLSRDEVINVLQVARVQFTDYYPLMLTAFRTGMRMGEVLGLAWEDVDFDGNAIEVRRAYSHGRWETPKSHKSRYIDMSDQLRVTLYEYKTQQLMRFDGQLPVTNINEKTRVHVVFTSQTGGPLCGDNFRSRVFNKLLEAANVPKIRFHDIRHTFASLLLANNESLHYVKEQMGHASIQTTVDVYGHLVPGSNRNAVNRLDDPEGPSLRIVSQAVV